MSKNNIYRLIANIVLSRVIPVLFVFVVIMRCSGSDLFAYEIKGTIINVIYNQKIAFTDLTNEDLDVGDMVEVNNDGRTVVFMKVVGTSDAVSKLSYEKVNGYDNKVSLFQKVSVGSTIRKLSGGIFYNKRVMNEPLSYDEIAADNFSNSSVNKDFVSSIDDFEKLSINYLNLSNKLTDALNQKEDIQNELLVLKKEVEPSFRKLSDLELENEKLIKSNELLVFEINKIREERKKSEKEAQISRQRLLRLKGRLEYIVDITDQKLVEN